MMTSVPESPSILSNSFMNCASVLNGEYLRMISISTWCWKNGERESARVSNAPLLCECSSSQDQYHYPYHQNHHHYNHITSNHDHYTTTTNHHHYLHHNRVNYHHNSIQLIDHLYSPPISKVHYGRALYSSRIIKTSLT